MNKSDYGMQTDTTSDILSYRREGMGVKKIASLLSIAKNTVKAYLNKADQLGIVLGIDLTDQEYILIKFD